MKLTKEEVLAKDYDWQIENVIRYADYLVCSEHWTVRSRVVVYGDDSHRDILVNDKDWKVRAKVAIYGNDTHRDILVNDKHWAVRELVTIHGNDTHRDILVHDTELRVRYKVAKYGNDTHRGILMSDENEDVKIQNIAKEYRESTYHRVETDFGTYNGILSLWVWEDKYEIHSGCYRTNNIEEWFDKCESQLDTATATKYTNIMKDLIGGIQSGAD